MNTRGGKKTSSNRCMTPGAVAAQRPAAYRV
jgi:hypothetical protein